MLAIEEIPKGPGARYVAKAEITPDGKVRVAPAAATDESAFGEVSIAWYSDCIKVTLPAAAPAVVSQAYLTGTGRDVIIELVPRSASVEVDSADAG
jgi:hypothetical protein